jgi:hypothetical protein
VRLLEACELTHGRGREVGVSRGVSP